MTLAFKEDNGSITFVINNLHNNYRLSNWEKEFIYTIKERFFGGGDLTPKQLEKLSNLWEKY